MTDDASLQRQFRAARDRAPETRDGCIEVNDLAAAAQRTDAEAVRLQVLEHIATCAACRREFDLLRTVAETRPAQSTGWVRWGASAAALAAVLLLLLWRGAPVPGSAFRGPESRVMLHEAVVDSTAVRLAWRPIAGATRYILEVIAPDGTTVVSKELSDTAVAIPLDGLHAGTEYRWSVQASLRDGRTAESPFQSLRPAK